MEYIVDCDLANFKAWSGAVDTLNTLIEKGDDDKVETFIGDVFCGHTPTDTEINDFLWFETDTIADFLGYKDWDAYVNGEEDDESEEDFDYVRDGYGFYDHLVMKDPSDLTGEWHTTISKKEDGVWKEIATIPTEDFGVEMIQDLADLSDKDFKALMEKKIFLATAPVKKDTE